MRKTIILTMLLLVSAWAVAQDTTNPSAAGTSQSQDQSRPASPSQASPRQATPDAPAGHSAMGSGNIIEGCLGGTNPNYTVTDKSGTSYSLIIPAGADASVLSKHIGESVQVEGEVDNSGSKSDSAAAPGSVAAPGSSASSSSAASGAAGGQGIRVSRIGRGTSQCPASGNSAQKPPSK